MSDKLYTPDAWVVLLIAYESETIYKLMGGWYGGYLGSDSWQLNSGIESIEKDGDYYLIHSYSGSTYKCHESAERMSGLMGMMVSHWVAEGAPIDIVPIEDVDLESLKVSV